MLMEVIEPRPHGLRIHWTVAGVESVEVEGEHIRRMRIGQRV